MMNKLLLLAFLLLCQPAYATTSTIPANYPPANMGLTSSNFQIGFQAARNDINALWTYVANLASSAVTSLSGDASGTATSGVLPVTLNTVNASPGTCGAANTVPVVTVNAKGVTTTCWLSF